MSLGRKYGRPVLSSYGGSGDYSNYPEASGESPLPQYAESLASGAVQQSKAQQQDFGNQYFGSQIAPQWTAMLQGLANAGAVKGSEGADFDRSAAHSTFQPGPTDLTSYQSPAGASVPRPLGNILGGLRRYR